MKLKYVTVHKKVDNIFERNCVAAILLKIEAIYSLWLPLKNDKVAITHLTMEIHFQTRGSLAKKKIMFLHSKNKASRKGYKGEC